MAESRSVFGGGVTNYIVCSQCSLCRHFEIHKASSHPYKCKAGTTTAAAYRAEGNNQIFNNCEEFETQTSGGGISNSGGGGGGTGIALAAGAAGLAAGAAAGLVGGIGKGIGVIGKGIGKGIAVAGKTGITVAGNAAGAGFENAKEVHSKANSIEEQIVAMLFDGDVNAMSNNLNDLFALANQTKGIKTGPGLKGLLNPLGQLSMMGATMAGGTNTKALLAQIRDKIEFGILKLRRVDTATADFFQKKLDEADKKKLFK
jgi:hypothetical protein